MVNCPDCDKYFSDSGKLNDHMKNVHGGSQSKLFKTYRQTNYSDNYTVNDWYDVGRFMVENHIKAHPNGSLEEYKVHMLDRGIPEEIINIVMSEAGLSNKAIPWGAVILGLVSAAGGFATGQFIRSKLMQMGLTPVDAGKNIQDAINRVYAMRDRNLKVVKKGEGVSFICNDFTSKDVNRIINLTGNSFEDKQQLRMKDVVTTGDGFTGEIIGINGNHATILNKSGEKRYLHMKGLMKSDNIIYTKNRGMSTWDGLNLLERQDILKAINAPVAYAGRDWVGLEKTVKQIIKTNYGEKLNKGYECDHCGDKFGDEKEYDDHMEHHKNKKKAEYQETGHSKKYRASYIINGQEEYHDVIADNDVHAIGFLMMHLQNDHAGGVIDSIKLTIIDNPKVYGDGPVGSETENKPRVVFRKSMIVTKDGTMGGNGESSQHFQRIGRDAKKFSMSKADNDVCKECGRKRIHHWKDSSGVKISHSFKEKATETGGVYHGDSGDAGDRDRSSKQGNKDDNTFDQIKETKKKKASKHKYKPDERDKEGHGDYRDCEICGYPKNDYEYHTKSENRIYKSVDLRNPMITIIRKEKVNSDNTAKQFYEDVGTDETDKPDKAEETPKPKKGKRLPNLPNHEASGYAFRS